MLVLLTVHHEPASESFVTVAVSVHGKRRLICARRQQEGTPSSAEERQNRCDDHARKSAALAKRALKRGQQTPAHGRLISTSTKPAVHRRFAGMTDAFRSGRPVFSIRFRRALPKSIRGWERSWRLHKQDQTRQLGQMPTRTENNSVGWRRVFGPCGKAVVFRRRGSFRNPICSSLLDCLAKLFIFDCLYFDESHCFGQPSCQIRLI